MVTKQLAELVTARLNKPSRLRPLSSDVHPGATGGINAMPEASFTSAWYRPGRPMSQSERPPS